MGIYPPIRLSSNLSRNIEAQQQRIIHILPGHSGVECSTHCVGPQALCIICVESRAERAGNILAQRLHGGLERDEIIGDCIGCGAVHDIDALGNRILEMEIHDLSRSGGRWLNTGGIDSEERATWCAVLDGRGGEESNGGSPEDTERCHDVLAGGGAAGRNFSKLPWGSEQAASPKGSLSSQPYSPIDTSPNARLSKGHLDRYSYYIH